MNHGVGCAEGSQDEWAKAEAIGVKIVVRTVASPGTSNLIGMICAVILSSSQGIPRDIVLLLR
jgi:hypothetical protein